MSTEQNLLSREFMSVLTRVLGRPQQALALHKPEFKGNEWAYVKECIDTGWVSSVGKYVDEFERRLAAMTGARHAIAVVNGTAALHVALQVVGVRSGDEVLVPALSFVGTANAVAHAGGIPHFVDSHSDTLGMDADALDRYLAEIAERSVHGLHHRRTGRRIAAIVPMHTFGHPVHIERLLEVANRWGLPVVEDAAESLGSTSRGRHTGTFGRVGVLSFNGNKIITTGGGGAILTDDPELAKQLKHLTTTAKRPHRWEFVHDAVATTTVCPTSMRRLAVPSWSACRSSWRASERSPVSIDRPWRASPPCLSSISRIRLKAISGSMPCALQSRKWPSATGCWMLPTRLDINAGPCGPCLTNCRCMKHARGQACPWRRRSNPV